MSLNHDDLHPGCRHPNEKALFSLVPISVKAVHAVSDEDNEHLVSISSESRVKSLEIGFHINSQSSKNTLATLGRDNCDISLRPSSIARTHCSFEIDDLNTGVVMFYDRSHKHNTQVSGAPSKNFESGRSPRKVLVHPGLNEIISMGGTHGDLIKFKIEWILNENQIQVIARKRRNEDRNDIVNPRKARTRDPAETTLPSAVITPDQAFQRLSQTGLRYFRKNFLGGGSFGKVWRAIDVDSGRVMAMKEINKVPGSNRQEKVTKVRREVELMRRANHPHIAELITSQGWEDDSSAVKIYMGLEEGNLNDLSIDQKFSLNSGRPERCLQQILSALDFLAYKKIVHRDVKPENILCSRSLEGSGYQFRLSDFGAGKLAKYAYSIQGTHWYMAPEILRLRESSHSDHRSWEHQSPKVDVWSLFVTIAYARDVCNYRNRRLDNNDEILAAVREACDERWMSRYRAMAIEDPAHRATALDILNASFEGAGVTDRTNEIEMSEDNDDLFLDPQLELVIRNTPRRSQRVCKPFRIEKRTWPLSSRDRLTTFQSRG